MPLSNFLSRKTYIYTDFFFIFVALLHSKYRTSFKIKIRYKRKFMQQYGRYCVHSFFNSSILAFLKKHVMVISLLLWGDFHFYKHRNVTPPANKSAYKHFARASPINFTFIHPFLFIRIMILSG